MGAKMKSVRKLDEVVRRELVKAAITVCNRSHNGRKFSPEEALDGAMHVRGVPGELWVQYVDKTFSEVYHASCQCSVNIACAE